MDSRRIAIADPNAPGRHLLRVCVESLGHHVVADVASGKELAECCRSTLLDLVIADAGLIEFEGDDTLSFVAQRNLPLVLLADERFARDAERGTANRIAAPVSAVLAKPVRREALEPAIAAALARSAEITAQSAAAAMSRRTLEEHAVIDHAKALLMARTGIAEPEAYQRLRNAARQHRMKIVEIAKNILSTEELF